MAENVIKKSSKSNKTGAWRTFTPVVTEKCIGCGICVDYCPEACIFLENKKAKINYEYCKGCLICMHSCPAKAIVKK